MNRFIALVLLSCAVLFNSGCATLADAKAAKGTGSSRTYEKSYEVVWNAAVQSVKASGLELVSEDKGKGNILAQSSLSALSWGENVAIFVEAEGKARTRVEVVNKRAVAANVTAKDWEGRILEDLDKRLR